MWIKIPVAPAVGLFVASVAVIIKVVVFCDNCWWWHDILGGRGTIGSSPVHCRSSRNTSGKMHGILLDVVELYARGHVVSLVVRLVLLDHVAIASHLFDDLLELDLIDWQTALKNVEKLPHG